MNNTRWFSQNFFLFFMTWGIFLPYWTGFLVQGKGLDISEASLIMGFGLVVRGVSALVGYPYASKFLSAHKVVVLLIIGSLVATLLYIPSTSFTSLFVVTLIFSVFYPTLLPAVESTAGILMQKGDGAYGKARSFGSLGFIISVLVISMLTGQFGDKAILWAMICMLVIMLIKYMMPSPTVLTAKPIKEENKHAMKMSSLWKIKSFPIVLLIVFLLQGAHASYYNYGYMYLQDIGVNSYYIGMIINIAVIFEIICFAKADYLFGKWKPSSLLLIAAAGSTLRWLLIFVFPNVWIFMLSQSLHALSFALAHYAFILYITNSLPKEQNSNAQGVYSAFAMSFSTAILTLAGGFLYDISPGLSFAGMAICTLPAIWIILSTRRKYNY